METLFSDGEFGFLETNARLQVEHGVTEEVTGVDLVVAQLRLAAGEPLSELIPDDVALSGFAVEARVYAEDPVRLLPSAGRLLTFRPPALTGVRTEVAYREGQTVTPYYDPLLAKVIGVGTTREQAIGRTLVALKAFDIRGVETNRATLQTSSQASRSSRGGCIPVSSTICYNPQPRMEPPPLGSAATG